MDMWKIPLACDLAEHVFQRLLRITKCKGMTGLEFSAGFFAQQKESNVNTPPKFNIEPENEGLVQMIFLFKGFDFQVPC